MTSNPTTQQLALLPDALVPTGPKQWVSSRSRWEDGIWRLDYDYYGAPGHGATLYWPDDIAPWCIELLKKVIWSLVVAAAGRPVSTSTLGSLSSAAAILGRFITNGEYLDLSELDETAICFLTENLKETAQHIDQDDYEDIDIDEPDELEDLEEREEYLDCGTGSEGDETNDWRIRTAGKLSHSLVRSVFHLIAMIHRQRHALRAMGLEVGDVDPLAGETPLSWAARVRPPAERVSQPIPDDLAIPLMTAADRLLGTPADEVIDLQERYLHAQGRAVGDKATAKERRAGDKSVAGRPFAVLVGEIVPWHPVLPQRGPDGQAEPIPNSIRELVVLIRDACVITLLQLTGIRIGEIVALRAATDPTTGLPMCVVKVRSASGERDLFYAESYVNKGRDVPERELWLIGCTAAGSNALPIPVRAIQILQRLLAPWRELALDERARVSLLVCLNKRGLPETPNGVGAPTISNITRSLKRAYGRLIDWHALPDRARNGVSLARFKRTEGWCIHGSHWRKNFATNILRADSRLLNAVRRHFKHMNLATTEGEYVGHSIEVLEDIDEAQVQMTLRFLRDHTRGGAPTIGRTGTLIKRNLKRIALMEEGGYPDIGKDMAEVLRASETGLWHADHGSCAINVSPGHARCHQVAGTVTYLNDRPNFEEQRAELCAGCRCFVADGSNLPYWRQRFSAFNAAKRAYAHSGDHAAAAVFQLKARTTWPLLRALRRSAGKENGGRRLNEQTTLQR
jgi:integrase